MTTPTDAEILEKIHANMELFISLVKRVKNDEVRRSLEDLCSEVGDRIATCPASTSTKYIGAFPGGLVWHSLEVLKVMKELNKIYEAGLSTDSLILTALFHDIGKIGNKEEDYYLPQESDWHVKNLGMNFTINDSLSSTPVPTRSLWWLTSIVPLTEEEIGAISSLQNMSNMYSSELYNAPMLTIILQQAVRGVCAKNKGKTNVLNQ